MNCHDYEPVVLVFFYIVMTFLPWMDLNTRIMLLSLRRKKSFWTNNKNTEYPGNLFASSFFQLDLLFSSWAAIALEP